MRSSPACVDLHDIVLVSRSINMLIVTDFVPKGIISGVRVQAGLHLDMLDADRSPNMQSAFLPELHRWISKLTARHLHACPPGDMVKETVILYKKEFRKMKKVVSLLDVKEMKARNDSCEIACDCVERANVVLHVGLCEEIFARKHTATHKPTSAQPLSAPLNAHLQVVILDNDLGILERMQDGVHSSTTGASAQSWWVPTPASWYSFFGPPECNGGPAGGVSCWKILDIYNRVALATLVGPF